MQHNTQSMKNQKALILAGKLAKLQPLNETQLRESRWRSWLFRTAYAALELYGDKAVLIEVTKKDGSKDKRVVLEEWFATHLVNGKGRPVPAGCKLFTDLAKSIAGKKDTVMFLHWEVIG